VDHDLPDLQAGGDIIADEKVVAVWPPDTTELRLFARSTQCDRHSEGACLRPSAAAGGLLGNPARHAESRRRRRQFEFGLFDPRTQQHVWQRSLSGVVDWGVVDSSDFYVLQSDGTLRVLDDQTGFDLVELSLRPPAPQKSPPVWSDADHWYAATYSTPPNNRVFIESQQPQSPPVHGVVLAASRSTGEVEWQVPCSISS